LALRGEDISRLYERHAVALLRFFAARTYDPDVALELLAETFASAFEDRAQFRGGRGRQERAWLYAIARHQLGMYWRRGRVERAALGRLGVSPRSLSDEEYERVEDLVASRSLRRRVAAGLAGLPDEQREAVRLRVVDEQPYDQVAAALGISEQAARARVSRGLRALRLALEPHESHA